MAEFCLECWNRMNETEDSPKKYIISKELELCEGCGEWKRIIIAERKYYYLYKARYITLPFRILYRILYFLWRLFLLPYSIYKYKSTKDKESIS